MGFAIWLEVYCDGDDCAMGLSLSYSTTQQEGVKEARQEDWSFRRIPKKGLRSYCPDCTKKRRKRRGKKSKKEINNEQSLPH